MLSVCDMLKYTTMRFPDKYAVVWDYDACTYKKLQSMVNCVANYLKSKGYKKGDVFGIYSHKSIHEVVAIFAILKIGGIFVNINPSFKTNQIRHMISECKIETVFVSNNKESGLQDIISSGICMNVIIYPNDAICLTNVNTRTFNTLISYTGIMSQDCSRIYANDVAAIVYTSGSTGDPKGIILTHDILSDATIISALALGNVESDKIISLTSFAFDGALSQLFTSIYVGATLVLQQSMFPNDIVSTLVEQKITGMHTVPSLLKLLMQKHSLFLNTLYPELRYLTIVGEVFDQKSLLNLQKLLPNTEIFIIYGTTEAFRSTYLSTKHFRGKCNSVGKPFAGVSISIKNERGEDCLSGDMGEIVHTGVFISPGYWNDFDKTKQVFKDGAVYTGDIGWLDEEGFLYFVGRKDNRIKRFGYRLSLEEIEEHLCQCPMIIESAVVAKYEGDDLYIKGFVVIDKEFGMADVQKSIRTIMPYYMIPDELIDVEALPKTDTFKIDRKKLQ